MKIATAATLLLAAAAHAADKPGCVAPTWAAERMPGFELTDCEHWDWARFEVQTSTGNKQLEGKLDEITYTLVDETKDPTNDAAREFFAAAGKKAGATQASGPGGWAVFLQHKTGKTERWYAYRHGSGNDTSTGSYTLTTLELAPLKQEVVAQASDSAWDLTGKPCKDPPWLKKQFPYFKLESCTESDFDQEKISTTEGEKILAGHFYRVTYELTDPAKSPVSYAVWKNYVDALQGIGAKLVTRPDDDFRAYLTRKTPHGEQWYLYAHGAGNDQSTTSYSLVYVLVGGPPLKTCTLQVYGVNFDFNKATLRPDSEPVLEQLLTLFKSDAGYAAEIGGHTDDIGDKKYNLELSGARAKSVMAWLTDHGVDAKRLSTAGYGDTRPRVPNTNDESRAQNRRVELKRNNCK